MHVDDSVPEKVSFLICWMKLMFLKQTLMYYFLYTIKVFDIDAKYLTLTELHYINAVMNI